MKRRTLLQALRPLLLLGLALASTAARAQPTEDAVKAAFLPKFARYVAWPAGAQPRPGEPFVLCIIGSDPFGRTIDDAVRGQQIDQHPIVVRRLTGAEGAVACHIAFVRGSGQRGTADLLAALGSRPVLTVTDERGGPRRGEVHFVIQEGRVRFHIDQAAAARAGLDINSRLLALALSVRQRP